MESFFSILGSLSPILQIVILVALCVIFWEPIAFKVFGYKKQVALDENGEPREKNSKDWFDDIALIVKEQSEHLKLMASVMGELAQHYNHDTTEELKMIREGIEKIIRRQDEWHVYGIPTRDCVKK